MALISTKDLEYQPKTEDSSFIDTKIKKKFRIKIFISFLIIFIFTSVLLGYFLSLNYFRVISLTEISPFFKILPTSSYDVKDIVKNNTNEKVDEISVIDTNTFAIEGTFDGFDEVGIKIRTKSGKILKFELGPEVIIRSVSEDRNQVTFIFTNDLLQKENIGRKINAEFIKKDNKNLLITAEID